ncbi:hypothetical protein [Psychrobacillus lasiicapitis]|uniref:DNA primase n=1 Tax=Psychrobacillus lasiicapitis TaxID=1636719 RepID=A0A544SX43_9BACI|nr:hypothetical protein [Psychrobacillus lasiicapitis]TQR09784.1 hypothetical protein FG382_18755 [Psychrobacillus lasiicapitis]GGA23486.1 hypothetical protein GCM10011384_11390 [Psychrobacillus lasiicapitis]
MTMNLNKGHKWWKLSAATFLSVGLLAACGDDPDDNDMNDPVEEDVDLNVDVEDNDSETEDTNVDKENVEETDEEVMDKDRE